MCVLCQANSLDHAIELIKIDIDDNEWTVVTAPAANGRPPWVYTIGLERSFDHPELLVVTCDVNAATPVLDRFAEEVAYGERFFPGDRVPMPRGEVEILEVGVRQRTLPLLPMRTHFDAAVGQVARPRPPRQLVVPGLDCPDHPISTWRLDRDVPLLAGTSRPPRQLRRRPPRHDRSHPSR